MLLPSTTPKKTRQQRVFNSWSETKQSRLYICPFIIHLDPNDSASSLPPDSCALLVLQRLKHLPQSSREGQGTMQQQTLPGARWLQPEQDRHKLTSQSLKPPAGGRNWNIDDVGGDPVLLLRFVKDRDGNGRADESNGGLDIMSRAT